jgi:hypothetical protein
MTFSEEPEEQWQGQTGEGAPEEAGDGDRDKPDNDDRTGNSAEGGEALSEQQEDSSE